MEITNKNIIISLIYEGELNSGTKVPKDKYFVMVNPAQTNETFEKKEYTEDAVFKSLKLKKEDIGDKNYIFYIIRHGDGVHNAAKAVGNWEKIKETALSNLNDAELTTNGKDQAKKAGDALKKELNETIVNYFFASDLYRTRQTLEGIYKVISATPATPAKPVIILPCSHELDFKSGVSCDAEQGIFEASENKMSCIKGNEPKCIIKIKISDEQITDSKLLSFNWVYYKIFYDGYTRENSTSKRYHCRDTTMISMSIFIIKHKTLDKTLDKPNGETVMKTWIENRK